MTPNDNQWMFNHPLRYGGNKKFEETTPKKKVAESNEKHASAMRKIDSIAEDKRLKKELEEFDL